MTFALLADALVMCGVVVFATPASSDEEVGTDADAIEMASTSPTTEAAEATTPQVPGVPTAVQVGELFIVAAIAALIDEIVAVNGTEPMQLVSVLVYREYLTAQGQWPGIEESIIEHRWVGRLAPAAPAQAAPTDDLASRLFGSGEVGWSAISALVEAAPAASATAIPPDPSSRSAATDLPSSAPAGSGDVGKPGPVVIGRLNFVHAGHCLDRPTRAESRPVHGPIVTLG